MLIAEIGQNHNGDMHLARELISAAKSCGADVAKFQVFEARSLFSRSGNPWFEYNLATELRRSQVEELAQCCADVGIEFMASAFDPVRVGWLEDVGVRAHKIASRSIHDDALIAAVAATGKDVIVSLGMWQGPQLPVLPIDAPVHFLHCISQYPTPLGAVKLADVDFTELAGFSDHTVGRTAAFVAIARGARIVEKHFTLDKTMYGPDHAGSADPADLRAIARFMVEAPQCL